MRDGKAAPCNEIQARTLRSMETYVLKVESVGNGNVVAARTSHSHHVPSVEDLPIGGRVNHHDYLGRAALSRFGSIAIHHQCACSNPGGVATVAREWTGRSPGNRHRQELPSSAGETGLRLTRPRFS